MLVGEYTSLAFLLPVCVVLGYGLGYLIDQEFGTDWIKYAGLLVGVAAGMTQLIRQLMRDTKDEGPNQDE